MRTHPSNAVMVFQRLKQDGVRRHLNTCYLEEDLVLNVSEPQMAHFTDRLTNVEVV